MTDKNIRAIVCSLWCTLFLVPLLNNTLHYVIIDHHFGNKSNALEFVDSSTIHYCEQYLCKLSSSIENLVEPIDFWIERLCDVILVEVVASYKECLFPFYWLRGPPAN
ncbi:hypothetical protein LNQ81_06905 [Myroides sp. M-43]|uniref:hypothetical protein n=1 Tax=Myroides oncorhynchi TaxID=2893756 RepID=UPI001E425F15|nr:hypothetical protein [Myroides oncorhynchi]MCC9042423.1 hypothetical protein [Myroides oncorhynchi]